MVPAPVAMPSGCHPFGRSASGKEVAVAIPMGLRRTQRSARRSLLRVGCSFVNGRGGPGRVFMEWVSRPETISGRLTDLGQDQRYWWVNQRTL